MTNKRNIKTHKHKKALHRLFLLQICIHGLGERFFPRGGGEGKVETGRQLQSLLLPIAAAELKRPSESLAHQRSIPRISCRFLCTHSGSRILFFFSLSLSLHIGSGTCPARLLQLRPTLHDGETKHHTAVTSTPTWLVNTRLIYETFLAIFADSVPVGALKFLRLGTNRIPRLVGRGSALHEYRWSRKIDRSVCTQELSHTRLRNLIEFDNVIRSSVDFLSPTDVIVNRWFFLYI